MRLAMIGLGRMGGNMSERLMKGGHEVVAFDRSPEAISKYSAMGAVASSSAADAASKMTAPRIVWVMVPAGKPTDDTITELATVMKPGDVIIDGGNSNFHDSMRRAADLAPKGIEFIDAGTSGGIWGLANGYCLMIGASDAAFSLCEPIFKTLAPENGYAHVGPPGSGHYVKMIHNGVEYGMLQAYAEGYEILHASKNFKLDLHQIATVWNKGSVVRSWINELAEEAFKRDANLDALKGYVEDSGEGRWTVQEAIDLDVPAPVITLSLLARLASRQPDSFSAKVIATIRNEFGGHAVKKS
ncbi:MAG: decarboxylating 6-phosphogluconate dehydrogenase [Gemmatimonadaceae bacterium]|nr:decarboxylating 6-phosphogluconate dehydrogenase [Gemmatimonadaceae bacterium]